MSTSIPARLSNLAIDRAVAAGEHWQRYRASRRESVSAYIEAGKALMAGLAEVRHGGKGAFYARAGIPQDTAERMLLLARAGATVDDVLNAGGIRAMTERLRRKPAQNPHGADFQAGEERPDVPSEAGEGWRQDADTRGEAAPVLGAPVASEGQGRTTARAARKAARRAAGQCETCGREPAVPGRRQGERCLERDRKRNRKRLAGKGVMTVLEAAASRGEGLSAEDVAGLVRGKRR